MKKLIALITLLPFLAFAQAYTNWPPYLAPVATPFSAYWTLNATSASAGLSLLGGGSGSGIATMDGLGTNTTLSSGKSITSTNLSVIGTTWLNNSNMVIYYSQASGLSSNTSLVAVTGTNNGSITTGGPGFNSTTFTVATNFVAYGLSSFNNAFSTNKSIAVSLLSGEIFSYPITNSVVSSNSIVFNSENLGTYASVSITPVTLTAGSTYSICVYLPNETNQYLTPLLSRVNNPAATNYLNSYFYTSWSFGSMASNFNVSGSSGYMLPSIMTSPSTALSAKNIITNSVAVSIIASNGIAIDAGSTGIDISSKVDASGGFYINGKRITGGSGSGIGFPFLSTTNLLIYNASGTYTNFNGVYVFNWTFGYYTNSSTNFGLIAIPGTAYTLSNSVVTLSGYVMTTNINALDGYGSGGAYVVGLPSSSVSNSMSFYSEFLTGGYYPCSGNLNTNLDSLPIVSYTGDTFTNVVSNIANAQIAASGVVTNDPSVLAFIAASGIADEDAKKRLFNFANYLKKNNAWHLLNDVRLFGSYYNPTSSISLFQKPWRDANPTPTFNGYLFHLTNSSTGELPEPILASGSHSEIYVFNTTQSFADVYCKNTSNQGDPQWNGYANSFIGGIIETNTGAGHFVARGRIGKGCTVWEHNTSATNFGVYPNTSARENPNGFIAPDAAGYSKGGGPFGLNILQHSSSNYFHKVWQSSVRMIPNVANQSTVDYWQATNALCTNQLNALTVGTNWQYVNAPLGWYRTNSVGMDMFMVFSLKTNLTDQLASVFTTAVLMLLPQKEIRVYAGSSMLDQGDSVAYTTGAGSYTNFLGWIRQLHFQNDIYFSYGTPGGNLNAMNNLYAIQGSTAFPTALFTNIVDAGKTPILDTDLDRNGITDNNATVATAITSCNTFFSRLPRETQIRFIGSPMQAPRSSATAYAINTNFWLFCNAMRTNKYIWKGPGGFTFPIGVLSTNDVNGMSYSGAHLDNPTNGVPFMFQQMWAIEGNEGWFNPTNTLEPWIYGGNILPAGDNANLIMLTNSGTSTGWKIK
jgi:hypothetical protein